MFRFRESEITQTFELTNNQNQSIMKALTTTLFLFIAAFCMAQTNYEKAMTKGLETMQTDLNAAAQQFERITAAEKENWLPPYYAALAYINSSWGQNPKEQTLASMKKAQEFIDKAEMHYLLTILKSWCFKAYLIPVILNMTVVFMA